MTDRQAAEARERVAAIRKRLRWFAGRTTLAGNEMAAYVRELCDTVDALSVRLAQAEQASNFIALRDAFNTEAQCRQKWYEAEERAERAEVRLREYEEALTKIADGLELPDGSRDLYAAHAAQEIARAAVAASGGREAPKEETLG